MLTLYHSPWSRSTTIVAALLEMNLQDQVAIRTIQIKRQDGTGGIDPDNPHPDGKVPILSHEEVLISERPAILTYLSDLYPDAPGIRPAGHALRGPFLTWLAYYGDVMEPVFVASAANLSHPIFASTFRGTDEVMDRLSGALSDGRDYLLSDGFSTADLLLASPFQWFPDLMDGRPEVQHWVNRVSSRPAVLKSIEGDKAAMLELA